MSKKQYSISARAKKAMENELRRFPHLETGGLLLGYSDSVYGIQVLEAVDGGYQNVLHESRTFQYDNAYVVHVCEQIAELYTPPLAVVGLWHKHNTRNEIPFSRADETMHNQMLELYDYPCLSVLFERGEPESEGYHYQMRAFQLDGDGHIDISENLEIV